MSYLKKMFFTCTVVCLVNIPASIKPYPHIPLKGLFEILNVDDIGFGQSLLHSNWIENMYQYGAGKPPSKETENKPIFANDLVANLVRTLWFRFSDEHSLEPTQVGVLSVLTPAVFGKLMNEIYQGAEDFEELIDQWSELYEASIKRVKERLGVAEEKQKEYQRLSNKQKKLPKELKSLKNRYSEALNIYKQQQDKLKAAERAFKANQGEDTKKALGRIVKKLKKTEANIGKIEDGLKIKEQELNVLQGHFKSMPNPKKAIENIKWELRKVGSYLGVKKIDEKVIEAIKIRVNKVIGMIKQAVAFCVKDNLYMPRTVEAILWAFFFHKVDKLRSQNEKVNATNECIAKIDQDFKNNIRFKSIYSARDFSAFEERIKDLKAKEQIALIFNNYDLALHFFISKLAGKFPPQISQGSFGYEFEKGKISGARPNCYETAMHDLFSVLWYNSQTGTYDDSLFSEEAQRGEGFQRFKDSLKYFYLADCKGIKAKEYTVGGATSFLKLNDLGKIGPEEVKALSISKIPVSFMDRSVMKQEFMNIVSGKPDIKYYTEIEGKKIFELLPSVKNFINLFNYFFGTKVENVEDLGDEEKGISTENRKVSFAKDSGQDAPNRIKITVYDQKAGAYFDMLVDIMTDHVTLSVPAREQAAPEILKEGVEVDLLKRLGEEIEKIKVARQAAVFTLFTSKQLLKEKNVLWTLPILNLVYYSLLMKDPYIKLAIIKDVLERYSVYYKVCKDMMYNLLSKFPFDDRRLCQEINKIFELALEQEKKDFAEVIVNNENFVGFGRGLSLALKKGYDNIAKNISENPKLSLRARAEALSFALEEGWRDVAFAIANNDKFDATYKSFTNLGLALEKDYKDIAEAIVNNKKFNARHIKGRILCLALKKGYDGIAKKISENAGFSSWIDALDIALGEGWTDVAEAVVSNKKFDPSQGDIKGFLWRALKGGADYNKAVSKIVSNEKFDPNQGAIEEFLLRALEEREDYRGIVLKTVSNKKFNADFSNISKVLELALKKGYEDIAAAIVMNKKFKAYQADDAFWEALEKGYKDIAVAIVKNRKFNALQLSRLAALKLALKKGYKDVAVAIVKKKKFDAGGADVLKELELALKKGYKDVAEAIVKHKKFNASNYQKIFEILKLALEKGYKDFVEAVVKNETFLIEGYGFSGLSRLLEMLLEKEYKDIAEVIVNHKSFDAGGYFGLSGALKGALEKDYKEIAKAIVNDEKFAARRKKSGEALSISLKKGYKEIAEKILNASQFYYWVNAIVFAIKKGWKDIALQIVNHPTFDITKVDKCLSELALIAESNPERKEDVQEVMSIIKQKQQ